jgi:transcriptional regulator with XRE-family HTH domain
MTVTNVELLKLGLRIRASRKVLGWTQKRLSRNCGLDRSYFGGVERGKRNMTFSVLCQICDSLSCDIATVTKGIPHLQTSEEVTKEYGSGANLKRPAHSRNARDYGTDLGTRSVQGAAL